MQVIPNLRWFCSVPDEFNRVIIPVKRGEENTDYVNASFIDVSLLQPSSIFSQWKSPHAASFGMNLSQTLLSWILHSSLHLTSLCVTGWCCFLSPRNPWVFPAPCGRGELEPEQLLGSLLPLWALLMAVQIHVSMEITQPRPFGQETSPRADEGAVHDAKTLEGSQVNPITPVWEGGRRRGREVKCCPHCEQERSDCTSFSPEQSC